MVLSLIFLSFKTSNVCLPFVCLSICLFPCPLPTSIVYFDPAFVKMKIRVVSESSPGFEPHERFPLLSRAPSTPQVRLSRKTKAKYYKML